MLKQFRGMNNKQIIEAGYQVLTHINTNGTTQTKHIISNKRPLPTVQSKGNSKLQNKGKYHLLTFARLGQATKDLLTKDNYIFANGIPDSVCGNCETCKGICYNKKQYFRDNHANNRINNYLHSISDTFTKDMIDIISKQSEKGNKKGQQTAVRINVEGELDIQYLEKILFIAKSLPMVKFYTYTKMYDLMLEYANEVLSLDNINIMISSWSGQASQDAKKIEILSGKGFKVYYARSKDEPLPTGFADCKDDCNNCNNCIEGKHNATCKFH